MAAPLRTPPRHDRRDRARPWPRSITLVAVALGSALAGAVCLGAAQQVQESRKAQAMLVSLTLRETAAQQAATIAKQAQDIAQKRLEAGVAAFSEVSEAASRTLAAETTAHLAQLDVAEMRASLKPVRNDLAAPTINGRDFVLERLTAQQDTASAHVNVITRGELDRAKARFDAGLLPPDELATLQISSELDNLALKLLSDKIAIRKRFATGQLNAQQTEQQGLVAQAVSAQKAAERKLAVAQQRLATVTNLHQKAAVSLADVNQAQLAVANAQVELQIANAELAAVQTPD
ncbi:MAG: hypothetical protein QM783_04120 [Phycisphaerales bacterium]